MGVVIPESGMQFGEYKEEQVFQIEKCKQYTEKLRQQGVKSCEFILLRAKRVCFIEAKMSYPNPLLENSSDEEKKKLYRRDIQDIVEKMRHSMELFGNILLNRYSQEGISDALKNASTFEIRLILVIKNADKSWIVPLQDLLRKELRAEMSIWKIPDFIVLNEEQARKKHFII